jgi:hypothetical protein
MVASDYFSDDNLEETEKNEQHVNRETSRELKVIENNKDVLQLKENDVLSSQIEINNFIVPENSSDNADIILDNKNKNKQVNNITKIITLEDYEALNYIDSLKHDKRSNLNFFKDKLFVEHSLFSLIFKKSLKDPIYLRMLMTVFTLSLQFASNAILITDNFIDQSNQVIICYNI